MRTMTTERHAWYSSQSWATAEPRIPAVCACGQELDCCTRDHCPRCGVSLTSHAV